MKHYKEPIIESNIDRISLLHLSDVFSYDFILSSIPQLSQFSRLKTLIIYNIESEYLENLLYPLRSLSLLSSVVITTVDKVKDKNMIYRQIFRLPALKYCKLSLLGCNDGEVLPFATNEYSPIEHLVITNTMYLNTLHHLLSYVPYLHRLSLKSLKESYNMPTEIFPCSLRYLKHISFNMCVLTFNQFQQLVINSFCSLEILHFTITDDSARIYSDAKRWQQLIETYMFSLRIFDIQITLPVRDNDDQLRILTELNQFTSSFWAERKWFFAYDLYEQFGKRCMFYSINPYRYCLIYF